MKKVLVIVSFLLLWQIQVQAASCPLSSYESRLEYRYSNSFWLICDYQNGRLVSRFQHNGSETESIDYHSNGMPREYNLRTTNMGGGLYAENKKYNQSGMLIGHSLISGNYGYDCSYAGNSRLKCISFENGVSYYASVEYASQYEGN